MSEQGRTRLNWRHDNSTISGRIYPMSPSLDSGQLSQMCEVDINYLSSKNALLLPPKYIQESMLKGYIDYVHPFMPVLDLDHFSLFTNYETALKRDPLESRRSLLVLQSIMFSGSAFVELHDLQMSGYESRKACRSELFDRARALYDCNYESDPIAVIQSALLLSTWHHNYPNPKDTRHWISIAVSGAQKENLHRKRHYLTLDMREQKFRKRLWWACYMRDRLAALGLGRPMVIDHNASDMPLLLIEDFDEDLPAQSTCTNSTVCSLTKTAIFTIEMSKLCVCISYILERHYSTSFIEQGIGSSCGDTGHITVLSPNIKHIDLSTFENIADRLEQLASKLPGKGLMDINNQGLEQQSQFPPHIIVNSSFLHLTYHAASCALHRLKVQWSGNDNQSHNMSYQKLADATTHITSIVKQLVRMNLARFLAPSGAVNLLPAMIGHIRRMQSTDCVVQVQAMDDFYQCLMALQSLAEYHHIADYAISFLEAVTRNQNVCLPFNLRAESGNFEPRIESTTSDDRNLGHINFCKDGPEEDGLLWKSVNAKAIPESECEITTATSTDHISYLIDDRTEKFDSEPLLSSWDGSLHGLLLAPFPSDLYTF